MEHRWFLTLNPFLSSAFLPGGFRKQQSFPRFFQLIHMCYNSLNNTVIYYASNKDYGRRG